jgi:aspartate aminotransferase
MVALRAREAQISGIRKLFESAPPDAINLGLGEPDFDPPKVVIDALVRAVRSGRNHYGPSAGLPELRARIAERYRSLDPATAAENVLVTASGSEGLMASALSLYDPGDEVLVPDPGFVLYAPHARLAGANPIPYALDEEKGFRPDFGQLESLVTPRTRAIVVNSPSNPTGAVFDSATVDRLSAFAEAHQLYLVSDEVYDGLVYRGRFASFWGRSDRAIIANSFSKRLAMTGWRLGFLVAPRALAVDINKIHYHLMACPSTPAQIAALAGLEAGPSVTRPMLDEFRRRRALVVRALNRIPGLTCVPPAGAFYAFPRFDWPGTASEVAHALLGRGLITTPGDAFGHRGSRHLRLSFAASRPALERGLTILRSYGQDVGA